MDRKRKVVFVCGRNAARSQMAEGFLRAFHGEAFEAASAGIRSSRLSRTATRVMAEIGIDISRQQSKPVSGLGGARFDLVVTLCDEAACLPESLLPPGDRYLHQEFPDPAAFRGGEEEILAGYRRVRDGIGSWISEQFGPGGTWEDTPVSGPGPKRRKR